MKLFSASYQLLLLPLWRDGRVGGRYGDWGVWGEVVWAGEKVKLKSKKMAG